MTRLEAEEMIKYCRLTHQADFCRCAKAKGFLEGLNSPDALRRKEVLGLVEIIEALKHIVTDEELLDINEALSKFQEAVKL